MKNMNAAQIAYALKRMFQIKEDKINSLVMPKERPVSNVDFYKALKDGTAKLIPQKECECKSRYLNEWFTIPLQKVYNDEYAAQCKIYNKRKLFIKEEYNKACDKIRLLDGTNALKIIEAFEKI